MLLGVSLAALVTIQVRREITVPDFLLRRIEHKLEFAQLFARFGRTAFDPTGNLVLEDVRLYGAGIEEPIARAGAVRLRLDFWAVLAGDFDVREIEVADLRFDCPALVSPSGTAEPVVQGLYGLVRRVRQDWDVPQVTFQAGHVQVTARGHWTARGGAGPHRELPADGLKTYCNLSRQAVEALRATEAFDDCRLRLAVTAGENEPVRVRAELTAGRAELPGPLVAEGLRVNAEGILRAGAASPLTATVAAARLSGPAGLVVTDIWIQTGGRLGLGPLRWEGGPVELAAAAVTRGTDSVAHPRAVVRLDALPRLGGEIAAVLGGGPLAAAAEVDLQNRAGTVRFEAQLTTELLNDVVDRAARWRSSPVLSQVVFQGPAAVRGEVRLAPGWRLERARVACRLGPAIACGVSVLETVAEAESDGHWLQVEPLVLVRPDDDVRGSYGMDLQTRDYRFLLSGRLYPDTIDPWFTDWWPRFWENFTFGHPAAAADIDIGGRWGAAERSTVWGRADAPETAVCGVPFDRVQATFFIRPAHYDISAFEVRRGGRGATGAFTCHYDYDTLAPQWIEFRGRSTLPVTDAARIFGDDGARIAAPFVFAEPPEVEASGRLQWDGQGRQHEDVTARVAATGELRFFGFPLEQPRFDFTLKDGTVVVPQLEARLAGGRLTGRGRVDHLHNAGQLSFQAELQDADLNGTVATWADYRVRTTPPGAAQLPDAARNLGHQGRLSVKLQAAGPVDNVYGLQGEGTAEVTHAELGEVPLLGLLSRALHGTLLGFTSLRFTDAQATFALEQDKLRFSALKLTGPTAALEGRGRYALPNGGLDFHVKLFPFRESNFPVFSLLGTVLDPVSRVMQVRLGGTLARPEWFFVAGPTNLLGLKSTALPPAPPEPAAPVPATGRVPD